MEVLVHMRLSLLWLPLAICACGFGHDGPPAATSVPARQGVLPALPSHVKLIDGFVQLHANQPEKPDVAVLNPIADTCGTCAHMLILRVPKDLDSQMIIRVPKQSTDRMPIFKGLPACPQDFR
jgi:hypothetical protein